MGLHSSDCPTLTQRAVRLSFGRARGDRGLLADHSAMPPNVTFSVDRDHIVVFDLLSCREKRSSWLSPRAHFHVVGMLHNRTCPLLFKNNSVLVSISVFVALSTVFHSINSPDNAPLSQSVLPVLILPYWSFQLQIFLWKSPSALIWSLVVDWA